MDKITLEFSLKPFCSDMSDEGFKRVAVKLFRQWEDLWLNSNATFQLMFWTADGSELLDYSGNVDDSFEYARYRINLIHVFIHRLVDNITNRISIQD